MLQLFRLGHSVYYGQQQHNEQEDQAGGHDGCEHTAPDPV